MSTWLARQVPLKMSTPGAAASGLLGNLGPPQLG